MASSMTIDWSAPESMPGSASTTGSLSMGRGGNSRAPKPAQGGFTLIEVMISMAVLTVGMVSLLGVFGLAMATTQTSQQSMIAKQLANEALESIITARNTSQISWDDINNINSPNCPISGNSTCGIFADPTVPQPIYQAVGTGTTGACAPYEGILGTTCDATQPVQTLQDPGPDGIYGTTDDVQIPLTGYQRTVLIAALYDADNNIVPTLRSVTITVQYATSQTRQPMTYVMNSYISEYQ
jgi:prepilin-type N-terminal cleavage/methylation domain-containing protein